jgi:hypothetical protein
MNLESTQFWLAAEEAEIMRTHGEHFSQIRLLVDAQSVRLWGFGVRGDERHQYRSGDGKTVAEAVAALAAQFPSGQQRIAKLRDQAKDLLRQAAEIEREGAP